MKVGISNLILLIYSVLFMKTLKMMIKLFLSFWELWETISIIMSKSIDLVKLKVKRYSRLMFIMEKRL